MATSIMVRHLTHHRLHTHNHHPTVRLRVSNSLSRRTCSNRRPSSRHRHSSNSSSTHLRSPSHLSPVTTDTRQRLNKHRYPNRYMRRTRRLLRRRISSTVLAWTTLRWRRITAALLGSTLCHHSPSQDSHLNHLHRRTNRRLHRRTHNLLHLQQRSSPCMRISKLKAVASARSPARSLVMHHGHHPWSLFNLLPGPQRHRPRCRHVRRSRRWPLRPCHLFKSRLKWLVSWKRRRQLRLRHIARTTPPPPRRPIRTSAASATSSMIGIYRNLSDKVPAPARLTDLDLVPAMAVPARRTMPTATRTPTAICGEWTTDVPMAAAVRAIYHRIALNLPTHRVLWLLCRLYYEDYACERRSFCMWSRWAAT